MAKLVTLRYFGGRTLREAADDPRHRPAHRRCLVGVRAGLARGRPVAGLGKILESTARFRREFRIGWDEPPHRSLP